MAMVDLFQWIAIACFFLVWAWDSGQQDKKIKKLETEMDVLIGR